MLSSIFSFNKKSTLGRWGISLGFGFIFYFIALFSWEYYISIISSKGASHLAVKNSYQLWAKARNQTADYGDCTTILVGASRIQMAIDLAVMEKYAPSYPIQLAIYGGNFLMVLESLANDQNVTGTVIVTIHPPHLGIAFDLSITPKWVKQYTSDITGNKTAFYEPLEQALTLKLDEHFSYRQKGAKPTELFSDLKINRYTFMDKDRRVYGDYSLIDEKHAYESKLAKYIGADPKYQEFPMFELIVKRINTAVDKIQARNGQVILFRPPSSRAILAGEKIIYPRATMWDVLADKTTAKTIHFADYPELTQFHLPDGVHLDYRDAAEFTEAFSKIVFDYPKTKNNCKPLTNYLN